MLFSNYFKLGIFNFFLVMCMSCNLGFTTDDFGLNNSKTLDSKPKVKKVNEGLSGTKKLSYLHQFVENYIPVEIDRLKGKYNKWYSGAEQNVLTRESVPTAYAIIEEVKVKLLDTEMFSHKNHFEWSIKPIHSMKGKTFIFSDGSIYLNESLLRNINSSDELAFFISYGMMHSELRHGVRSSISSLGSLAFFGISGALMMNYTLGWPTDISDLKPGRPHGEFIAVLGATEELVRNKLARGYQKEADIISLERMPKEKFNKQAFIKFLENIEKDKSKCRKTFESTVSWGSKTQSSGDRLNSILSSGCIESSVDVEPSNDDRFQDMKMELKIEAKKRESYRLSQSRYRKNYHLHTVTLETQDMNIIVLF